MSGNETIFIIDDNEERSYKLSTILNFVGEACFPANYNNWRSLPYDKARLIVVGSQKNSDDSIEFLEELSAIAPKLSVILIDSSYQKVITQPKMSLQIFTFLLAMLKCLKHFINVKLHRKVQQWRKIAKSELLYFAA